MVVCVCGWTVRRVRGKLIAHCKDPEMKTPKNDC